MKQVSGFPQCKATVSGKYIWNDGDSKYGVDIPVWRQIAYDVDCGDDTECEDYCISSYNALYISGKLGKKCYGYEVYILTKYTISIINSLLINTINT